MRVILAMLIAVVVMHWNCEWIPVSFDWCDCRALQVWKGTWKF